MFIRRQPVISLNCRCQHRQ